jgi:NADH:ubiquinone reductase (H+-translocating)
MERALKVVVVGAGFGGLWLMRDLARSGHDVVAVDQRNHHTFQPLLYQVATAGLHPQDVGHSLRAMAARLPGVRFRLGTVTGVDWSARAVELADGGRVPFGVLVVAAGAVTADYGVPGVAEHAFWLKGLADATRLRDHILRRFEEVAGHAADPGVAGRADEGALTFVVAGGGPTGVELAGALAELIDVLHGDFPEVPTGRARVVLVEPLDDLLAGFSPGSGRYALEELRRRGVDVRLGAGIARVGPDRAELTGGEVLPTATVVWAAGVRAHPLAASLDIELARDGRVVVDEHLRITGRESAFAIGDIAAAPGPDGQPLPQLAPVAIQQGRHVAGQIRRLGEDRPLEAFRYRDKGIMATIGRNAAVAELRGGLRLRGRLAWAAWLGLHLLYLVGFRNRLSVLLNWAWSYLTYDRGVRLVFSDEPSAEPTGGGSAPSASPRPCRRRTLSRLGVGQPRGTRVGEGTDIRVKRVYEDPDPGTGRDTRH